jgi:hypothetical protein
MGKKQRNLVVIFVIALAVLIGGIVFFQSYAGLETETADYIPNPVTRTGASR